MLDRNVVARIASRRGITKLDLILKDYIQDKILYYLFTRIGTNAVLKGGTALFKVYASPRFSLDLDITSIVNFNLDYLRRRLSGEGFKVHVAKSVSRGNILSFTWNIGAKGLGGTSIKIEINRAETLEPHDVIEYISPYPDIRVFKICIVTLEYMFKRKIELIAERRKVRDLFDAYFIAKTYGLKVKVSSDVWNSVNSNINRLKRFWRQIKPLLIRYELPKFEDVVEVLRQHVEVD